METSKSSSNPYVYDKPVTGEKFFGRRNEFEQIMRAASEHRLVVLRGQPKIGITSILLNLPSEMNYSHKVLYLDMREIAQNARRASDLWQAIETKGKSPLLSEAGSFSQKVDEGAVQHDDDGQFFQRSFLRETSYIRFIFDHFDAVASALDDMALTAFFRGFARILREERFVFIVASSTFPNKWKGAKFEDPSRVSVISISTLDREAARQLIVNIATNSLIYDEEAVNRIFDLTGGHPYFTQLLCAKVFDAARVSSTANVPLVTQTLVDSVVPDVLREGETVFEQLWESISMAQRPVMSALAELTKDEKLTFVPSLIEVRLGSQKQDVRLDELTVSLKNFADMQMLQEVEGRLRFIVPLFAMWVRERKPFQQTIEESKAQEAAQQTEQRNEILVNFALNDRPVGEDKLGYDDYAKAFAQVLANPDTKTPLTIGIYGSWGMGKSFLMEKIKEQLKTAKRAMEEERKKKGLGVKDYHDFHFVHFNAWVYSGSENLWAGLITKLYSEVEKYFGSLRLNWHLLIYNIRKNYKRTIVTLAIYGILGVLIAVLWDYKSVQDSWDALQIATKTLAGGSLVVALGSILKTGYDLFSKLVLARSEQLAAFSSRKDFKDKIGFMADIKAEVTHIGAMLNAGKRSRPVRFVIFIDDLDRCPPAKAVEVLEAIMLLLADDDGIPFIIFLGIDARVIVKAIEERYGKVLTDAGITGYEYLDKIVQIPFRIPPANETALKKYVESLLWRSDKERKEAKEREEKERKEKEEREQKEIKGRAQEVKQGVVTKIESGEAGAGAAAKSQTQAEGEGAVAASPDQNLPAQSDQAARESSKIPQVKIQSVEVPFKEEEQTAFKDFSRYYTPNPRRIKRIVNIYRIVRLLAGEQSAEFRRKMIKWVILSEQWPYRVAWVLQKIEDEYQLSHELGATLSLWSVFESVQERVGEGKESLANLDGDKEVFEVFAKLEPLITVGDIKQLRAYTFNLNPALQSEVIKAATVKPEKENLPKAMAMRV